MFCIRAISSGENGDEEGSTLLPGHELNFIMFRVLKSSSNLCLTPEVMPVDIVVLSDKEDNSSARQVMSLSCS